MQSHQPDIIARTTGDLDAGQRFQRSDDIQGLDAVEAEYLHRNRRLNRPRHAAEVALSEAGAMINFRHF
jgi:hypothetical protein